MKFDINTKKHLATIVLLALEKDLYNPRGYLVTYHYLKYNAYGKNKNIKRIFVL